MPLYTISVSGGGENGAFGAGLLCGWSEHGTRPALLVTGVSTGALSSWSGAEAAAWRGRDLSLGRRAAICTPSDQPFEAAQGLRKAAANASRTFIELLAALDRRRGKGGQQLSVSNTSCSSRRPSHRRQRGGR